jgi:nucleoside-diphosphate-sugar epimerase
LIFSESDRILVTGATGFLGGGVAAQLMSSPFSSQSLFLVRGSSLSDARDRLVRQLRRFGVSEPTLMNLNDDQIVQGDLETPSVWTNDSRLLTVTHVIHCAAIASFGNNKAIRSVNVDVTIALAASLHKRAPLKRFLYVGTAMVCGVQAPNPVPEDFALEGEPTDLVQYVSSKREAEAALRQQFAGLPLVIVRPSIVVGHSRLGCVPSGSIFWVFRMALALGIFPCAFDERIDVIPVDFAADALLTLVSKPQLSWDQYQLSAGEGSSCSFREIDGAIATALGRPKLEEYRQRPFEEIESMQGEFKRLLGPCSPRAMLRAIQIYGAFSSLGLLFDNLRILAEGILPPPAFKDYAGSCAVTSVGYTIAEQMQVDFK